MKRLISLTASILLAAALSIGASASTDAVQAYHAAEEKTAVLGNFDTSLQTVTTVSAQDKTIQQTQQVNTQGVLAGTVSGSQVKVTTTLEKSGVTVRENLYIKDGYLYVDALGQQVKTKLDESDESQDMVDQYSASSVLIIPDEILGDAEMKMDGENTVFTFKPDPSKLTQALQKVLAEGTVDVLKENPQSQITVVAVSGNAVMNPAGYILTKNIHMECAVQMNGVAGTISYEINEVNYNPGQPAQIGYPDLTMFREVSLK